MSIRSLIPSALLMCAVGCFASENPADDPADDPTGTVTENSTGSWACQNKAAAVVCTGNISVLPITVTVTNVRALNQNELVILTNDLNKLSILDGNILDNNKILNDVELTVLSDFLNKFHIPVTLKDINVCTTVLGILKCQ